MIDVSHHTRSTLKSLVDNLKVIEGHSKPYSNVNLCSVIGHNHTVPAQEPHEEYNLELPFPLVLQKLRKEVL